MKFTHLTTLVAITALAFALLAVVRLEGSRTSIEIEHTYFGNTPVTIHRGQASDKSLVVVAHGFAGSHQMMKAISLTLAHSGHVVVSFDYLGHGRHNEALSPDIHSLTGTTQDLVEQTVAVVERARQLTDSKEISLVGHSMATDVVVRAAKELAGVRNVVAISMYSEAVTSEHPERLLIVSGAHEARLREVALDAVAQIGPGREAMTITQSGVERRAVAAPWVGHVGVLWAPMTLSEIADWLGQVAHPQAIGPWIVILLISVFAAFWPISKMLPIAPPAHKQNLRRALMASILAAPVAFLFGLSGLPALGLSGFGALAACFGAWGVIALAILRPRFRFSRADTLAGLVLLFWGIGIFAIAMDRYAAAFLPTGPRASLMLLLTLPMIVFALADRVMVHGRHPIIRVLLRLPFLAALFGAMIFGPDGVGILFTVLPVLILFFIVYGTMAAWASRHGGVLAVGGASGLILAWSIAASTPLFAAV